MLFDKEISEMNLEEIENNIYVVQCRLRYYGSTYSSAGIRMSKSSPRALFLKSELKKLEDQKKILENA